MGDDVLSGPTASIDRINSINSIDIDFHAIFVRQIAIAWDKVFALALGAFGVLTISASDNHIETRGWICFACNARQTEHIAGQVLIVVAAHVGRVRGCRSRMADRNARDSTDGEAFLTLNPLSDGLNGPEVMV